MKKVAIVDAASGKIHDVEIPPGATAQDVLNSVGAPEGYLLSSGHGQEPFGEDEVIYDKLAEGSKAFMSTAIEVGV